MYSNFSFECVKKVASLARILGFSSITWNEKRQIFDCGSFSAYARTFLNFLFIYAYTLVIIPYNIMLTRKAKDYQQFNYTIVVYICALLGNVLMGALVVYPLEICQIANGLFLYLRNYEG